jgi:hypothetical protein
MSYQRISPDRTAWVQEIATKYPAQWEGARKRADGSRDETFVRILAYELNLRDPNIGLNGKRGTDVISTDALAYKNASAPGGAEVIDVIIGSSHSPAWQDVTIPVGSPAAPGGVLGKFIQPVRPEALGTSTPNPTKPMSITIDLTPSLAPLQEQIAQLTRDVAALKQQLANASAPAPAPGMPRSFKASMKTAHGKFVAFTDKGKVEPDRDSVGPWETVTFDRVD